MKFIFFHFLLHLLSILEGSNLPETISTCCLSSTLNPSQYPKANLQEPSKDWAVYVRARASSLTAEEERQGFTWIMPFELIYRIEPNLISSFHALLQSCQVGIFRKQPPPDPDSLDRAELLRISKKVCKGAVDVAALNFMELLLVFPTIKEDFYPLGMTFEAVAEDPEYFIFYIYFTKPPFHSTDSVLLALFNAHDFSGSAQFEQERVNVPIPKLGRSPNITSSQDQVYLWIVPVRDSKEPPVLLTLLNGPAGLMALQIFLNGLLPQAHRLILRRFGVKRDQLIKVSLNPVKAEHLLNFCKFSLHQIESSDVRFGQKVLEIWIEQTDANSYAVTVFVNFALDGVNRFIKESNIDLDLERAGFEPFLDLFKFSQSSSFALIEFFQRFIPDFPRHLLDQPSINIESNHDDDDDLDGIDNVVVSIFGQQREALDELMNSPTFFDNIYDWANSDPSASIIFYPGAEDLPASIVDDDGNLLEPPNGDTLIVSLSLPEPLYLNGQSLVSLVLALSKLLGSGKFSSFTGLPYFRAIRMRRGDGSGVGEKLPFNVECIIHFQSSNQITNEQAVHEALQEFADAFVLFIASHGFYYNVKRTLKGKGIEARRVFQSGPFPNLFGTSVQYITPSALPYPKYSLMKDLSSPFDDENLAETEIQGFKSIEQLSKVLTNQSPPNESIIVDSNEIIKESVHSNEGDDWSFFLLSSYDQQVDNYQFVTSLAALQKLIPDIQNLSISIPHKQHQSSLGLAKALFGLSKDSPSKRFLFCNAIRLMANQKGQSDSKPPVELALSLTASDKRNPKKIAQIIDQAVIMRDHGVFGLQLLFGKNVLISCLLLVEGEMLQNDHFKLGMSTLGKVLSERKYEGDSRRLFNSLLLNTSETWTQKILFNGETEPVTLMNSSIMMNPVNFEDWIEKIFTSSDLPSIRLFERLQSQIRQFIWTQDQDARFANNSLTAPIPRIQVTGQSALLERILNSFVRNISNRVVTLLGRCFDDNDVKISGLVASTLPNGKLSSLDFMIDNGGLALESTDKQRRCQWIRRIWKASWFESKWLNGDIFNFDKSSEEIEIVIRYGSPSDRKFITLNTHSICKEINVFSEAFGPYVEPVLEVGHEIALIIDKNSIHEENLKPINKQDLINDPRKVWVEWKSNIMALSDTNNQSDHDELLLFRRFLLYILKSICFKLNMRVRKHVPVIRIVTTAPGEYLMLWEVDSTFKKNMEKSIRQCMLDFVEMCGASPVITENSGSSGFLVKLWEFQTELQDSLFYLEEQTQLTVNIIDSPIIKIESKVNDEQTLQEDLPSVSSSFQKVQSAWHNQEMPEFQKSLEELNFSLKKKVVDHLKDVLDRFSNSSDPSAHRWTFSIGYPKLKDHTWHSILSHKNQPVLISTAHDLRLWTERLWHMTNDEYCINQKLTIIFDRADRRPERNLLEEIDLSSTPAAEGLCRWQRILLMILAVGPTFGDHVRRLEMHRDRLKLSLRLFYHSEKAFVGREVIERVL